MIIFNYIIYFCGAKEIKKQANYKTAKVNRIEIFLN